MRITATAACLSAALAASPALAQEEQVTAGPPDNVASADTVYDDTWLSIGAGIGYGPSYDGSDDYVAYPAPLIAAGVFAVHDISFVLDWNRWFDEYDHWWPQAWAIGLIGASAIVLILLFVYCLSGFLAGLGGVMSAARLYAANGLQIGQGYELDAIAAVILGSTSFVGGIGSIWGTLVGGLIIAVLTNGLILTGVSDIWQFIIKGMVIIGAVALDRYRLQGSART